MTDLPHDWLAAGAALGAADWRRLVVLGARDRGKSTFCVFLAERLARAGYTVGLLDADLGQKMIGPPGCVSLGVRSGDAPFALERIRFVGDTNPASSLAGTVAAVARLAGDARVDRLIVNTSGLVAGPGIPLKRWKIDALDPEYVVALAVGDELRAILDPLPQRRLHRLAPSVAARVKGAGLRDAARSASLAAALRGAAVHRPEAAAIEDLLRQPPPAQVPRLCGLADADGEDIGIGVALGGNAGDPLELTTAVAPHRIRRIRLGMAMPAAPIAVVDDGPGAGRDTRRR